MEKKQFRQTKTRPSPRTSTTKTTFCIPRFRTTPRKSTRLSPAMSLLDRFREAVFRLIMLSAISKAAAENTDHHHQESRSSSSSLNSPANCHRSYNYYNQSNDPHHSEAVADCIEFIKRSANDRGNRDSIDSTAEVVLPLPVM